MKVSTQKSETKSAFDKFDLVITVESQDEAEALFAIHNHAICDATKPTIHHDRIRNALRDGCKSLNGYGKHWGDLTEAVRKYS